MLKHAFYVLIFSSALILGISCAPELPMAHKIVNQSIEAHGGAAYDTLLIAFQFRDKTYKIDKKGGRFEYARVFIDSLGNDIEDVLNNEQFTRYINSEVASVTPKKSKAFKNALNSVVYFALLPHGLNDEAVVKEHMGEVQLRDEKYFLIKVSFEEVGGGEDHEDEFLYWVNPETHLVDYLAYSFHTDGGGLRFREVTSRKKVDGIVLQDYNNYKPKSDNYELTDLSGLFESGQLEKLSEIILKPLEE